MILIEGDATIASKTLTLAQYGGETPPVLIHQLGLTISRNGATVSTVAIVSGQAWNKVNEGDHVNIVFTAPTVNGQRVIAVQSLALP